MIYKRVMLISLPFTVHWRYFIYVSSICQKSVIMDHYKPKLITLPGGDQARHTVLQLLLHSQYKAYPRGLTEYGTGKKHKRLHQSYYSQSLVLVI